VTFKNPDGVLEYLGNKVVAEKLPPIFKKVKNDLFKFDL
jgi:23S rRNA pseudouridine955/2504/2580 synthase